jgi:dipeptidyl aminopeptidase/acylaminoacyl peptidase
MKIHPAPQRLAIRAKTIRPLLAAIAATLLCISAQAQDTYQKPPKAILDVLNAPVTPRPALNRQRTAVVFYSPVPYPPIADLSKPFARLAGVRIDVATNGPHNAPRFDRLVIKNLHDGSEKKVELPPDFYTSPPSWAPDGKHFAFTHASTNSIELWIVDAATAQAHRVPGIRINDALDGRESCAWVLDSAALLCHTIPGGRGASPVEPAVPKGPRVQESFGKSAPVPTYEDLLENDHDSDMFDYFATSQLALIDAFTGKMTKVGKPAIFSETSLAPDGKFILVSRIHRPYSFIVPASEFPRDVEVWDLTGKSVYEIASLPLQEDTPIGGVPTAPRDIRWRPDGKSATLIWAEALDDGNPKKKVPERDKIMSISAPFTGASAELLRTEKRFAGLEFGESGTFAILRDFDRDTLHSRAWFLDPAKPADKQLVWDLSRQERYKNPGAPILRPLENGHAAILQEGDFIFLTGPGGSSDGDHPFLDRMNINTHEVARIFQGGTGSYEEIIAMISPGAKSLLTRRESPADPPNYFLRESNSAGKIAEPGSLEKTSALTHFSDPAPQLRGIKKELVSYKRADGVTLSMTVCLPPDYKTGERRPAVVWAYPLEFTDQRLASQVTGSPYRFTTLNGPSELFFLLDGYVVLDNAAMPVVGDPETVNNTYIEQITADAKAAIDKAAEMGVVDPNRVGVGGHSYGAFMTGNLLAHSDLFRAGIARSGAYNRTLTPFGFQSERRTIWQAPEMYMKVSPFMYADKIKAPILLIHGEADNNSGTFPIQSDRMYRAIKGNGGSVRYVTLPDEAHGYAARESIEHVLWEMLGWFDKYVKNAPPTGASGNSTTAAQ